MSKARQMLYYVVTLSLLMCKGMQDYHKPGTSTCSVHSVMIKSFYLQNQPGCIACIT